MNCIHMPSGLGGSQPETIVRECDREDFRIFQSQEENPTRSIQTIYKSNIKTK